MRSRELTKKEFHPQEWLIHQMLRVAGFSSILIIGLIFIFLFKEAVLFFTTAHPLSLIGTWDYDAWEEKNIFKVMWQAASVVPKYSLIPLICGSFLVAVPATLIAALFGIGGAVYLSEIASARTRETLKPTLELLAGIPSVVMGFFMLAVAASLIQDIFHTKFRLNAFVGALGVAVLTIPVVMTIAEDAMRAVPRELRDASYALGATRWQTILGTVIPAAVSGISAAVILGFGRALGETMVVVMATGNAALVTGNVFSSVRTMTANIAAELGAVAQGSEHYYALFLVGAFLFTVTFFLNFVAEMVLNKMRSRLRM
ncbi:MAG: phosphate ABC transporter permease subunit PstC [Candidatus Omnitrophica bacterium]|nr:phosphate ABC transporter permease subunit PstC [Candidatus Omnitrophota bacterium]MDD5672241.1 phosphate ABC transporter permease subunit PstC [Candidatus Omnitrophota bacterium]